MKPTEAAVSDEAGRDHREQSIEGLHGVRYKAQM